MEEVEPDYKGALRIYWDIIKLPITLILCIIKKSEWKNFFSPLTDFWKYFWEAKFTAILIIVNFVIHIALLFYMAPMTEQQSNIFMNTYLANGPANIFSLNFLPFFSSMFVHASWGHIIGNMIFLFMLGRVVEKNFGTAKFALIYFGAGIIASAFDVGVHFSDMNYYAVGASGAIAGLASAAMLVEPFYLVCLFLIPVPVFLLGWLQVYTDVTSVLNPTPENNVANFAHLGGFFAITVLAFILSQEDRSKLKRGLLINLGTVIICGIAYLLMKKYAII
jgi:membrane associated rhomboid family serine protease